MAKILIVDDSRISRRVLRASLEKLGHTVIAEAGNGDEALRLYDEQKPDLVTMDITMPESSFRLPRSQISNPAAANRHAVTTSK